MARKHPLTEGKKNIIAALLQEYDIQSAEDIQEALKDLLGGRIQSMMEAEMDNHLGTNHTSALKIPMPGMATSRNRSKASTEKKR